MASGAVFSRGVRRPPRLGVSHSQNVGPLQSASIAGWVASGRSSPVPGLGSAMNTRICTRVSQTEHHALSTRPPPVIFTGTNFIPSELTNGATWSRAGVAPVVRTCTSRIHQPSLA